MKSFFPWLKIKRNKGGYFKQIKITIQPEHIIITKLYAANNAASKRKKQNWIKWDKKEKLTNPQSRFYTPLSEMNRGNKPVVLKFFDLRTSLHP